MPSNVEIKARLRDPVGVEASVRELADHGPELIVQKDVFFKCDRGRLKLRTFGDGRGELIFYRRLDTEGPTESEFMKTPIGNPDALVSTLSSALGETGVVRKKRTLYLVGQTRVHLDDVEGLGHYLELEVVLESGQSTDDGARIAQELMTAIDIRPEDLESRAYVDLLTSVGDGDGGSP